MTASDESALAVPVREAAALADAGVPQVDPQATLDQVVDAMVVGHSGVVLVLSDDLDPLCTDSAGGVVGIVSERDVIEALHEGRDLAATKAADVMSSALVSVAGSSTIEEVAATMVDHHIRHVLVRGADGAMGVVSMRTLVGKVVGKLADPEATTVR